nr:glycoside hydrolase family 66 protein [Thermoanaerobacter sp. X514]
MYNLRIKDVYPSKSQYRPGEKVEIIATFEVTDDLGNYTVSCTVLNFHDILYKTEKELKLHDEKVVFEFNIEKNEKEMMGFGVEVDLYRNNEKINSLSTSFDITESWKLAPRYGFLSDFFDRDKNDDKDLVQLNKYHINVVQFYDWMYRHHELLPPTNSFADPLGRNLSIDVVKQKIDYAHKFGMMAIAYGAVYGCEKEFYEEHKVWALYKNDGTVFDLINLIYIMDISKKCGWHDHIISEFLKAIKFGFDGIHMDQYGFPKEALSVTDQVKKIRKLRDEFTVLINDTREYIEKNGYKPALIFNAVNNWPIDTVASAKQDVVYIEVWPPNDTYQDLYNLITNAKKYAPDKQVILAAYMEPFSKRSNIPIEYAENATIMVMATIFASGGFHLLLGELNGILTEAYYPNYTTIDSERFIRELRDYYDFIVRYEEFLYDFNIVDNTMTYTGGINTEYVFKGTKFSPKAEKNSVWTLVKEKEGYKIIHLVNFTGVQSMKWNEGKEIRPKIINNIEATVLVAESVKGVYLASPDIDSGKPKKLDYEYVPHEHGKAIRFVIPELRVWDMVYIVCES